MYCRKCGALNPDESNYCAGCGGPLGKPAGTTQLKASPPPKAPAPSPRTVKPPPPPAVPPDVARDDGRGTEYVVQRSDNICGLDTRGVLSGQAPLFRIHRQPNIRVQYPQFPAIVGISCDMSRNGHNVVLQTIVVQIRHYYAALVIGRRGDIERNHERI